MALASSEAANPHWAPRKSVKDLAHIPGENGPPIIGTTFRVLRDPPGYGAHMVKTFGKVFRTNAFGNPSVSLVGPEANELMLFDRDKLFSNEQGWGPVLNLLFPRGLMLLDFDHHRMDRRALRPRLRDSCGSRTRTRNPPHRCALRSKRHRADARARVLPLPRTQRVEGAALCAHLPR